MNEVNNKPGCFGKLPSFADFIKFNAGSNGLVTFDNWLQNGLSFSKKKFGTNFSPLFSSANLLQFAFPTDSYNNLILGTLISSNDKSGREYPFIIFIPFLFSDKSKHSNLILTEFEDFFLSAEKSINKMKKIEGQNSIFEEIENGFSINSINFSHKKMQYQEYLNITTTYKLWSRLFGDFDDERKYIMLYNLTEILLPLRDTDLNNFTLGLKIPIVSDNEFRFPNMAFWISVCSRLVNSENLLPYLFWSSNKNNESYLLLFFSKPPSDNYAQMIAPDYLMDNICLTDREGNVDNCKKLIDDRYKSLIENKELTLAQFLQTI